jgi:hypothetical protein
MGYNETRVASAAVAKLSAAKNRYKDTLLSALLAQLAGRP